MFERTITITHNCDHKVKYQATGGATSVLHLIKEKELERCPDCKSQGR